MSVYKSDFYSGEPAITRHNFGKGTAYYIAVRTEEKYLRKLYSEIFQSNEIKPFIEIFDDEICVMQRGDNRFIMNLSDKERTASIREIQSI